MKVSLIIVIVALVISIIFDRIRERYMFDESPDKAMNCFLFSRFSIAVGCTLAALWLAYDYWCLI